MLEGIRVDYYGAKPPEAPSRRSGKPAVRSAFKPTHLAGFTRALTTWEDRGPAPIPPYSPRRG